MTLLSRPFIRKMRAYRGIGYANVRTRMVYFTGLIGTALQQAVLMVVMVYVWRAVYGGNETLEGHTLNQTVAYLCMARMLAGFSDSGLIQQMGFAVQRGDITKDLLRPVDFQGIFTSIALSQLAIRFVISAVVWLIVGLALGLVFPHDPLRILAFAGTLVLGIANVILFDWILASTVFYTTDMWGIVWMRQALANFFGGALVPLHFMPDWVSAAAQFLPYYQLVYLPSGLLNGAVPLESLPSIFLKGFVWMIGLYFVSRAFLNYSLKKVTVQGG